MIGTSWEDSQGPPGCWRALGCRGWFMLGWSNRIVTNSNAQGAKELDKYVVIVGNHQVVVVDDLLDSKSRRLPAELWERWRLPVLSTLDPTIPSIISFKLQISSLSSSSFAINTRISSNSKDEAPYKLALASFDRHSFCCIGCDCLPLPRRRIAKQLEYTLLNTRAGQIGLRSAIGNFAIPWLGRCEWEYNIIYQPIWWPSRVSFPRLSKR